jgi:UrcA family protein
MIGCKLAILATISIAMAGAPASAAPKTRHVAGIDASTDTRTVAYDDLNLTTQAGAKTLDSRVTDAVRALCPEPAVASSDAIADYQHCRRMAKEGTRHQVQAAIDEATRLASIPRSTLLTAR